MLTVLPDFRFPATTGLHLRMVSKLELVVVGESDEVAWVQTVERLLENKSLRAELSDRGRARVLTHFAWPVIACQHVEFFEQILGGAA